MKIDSSWTYDVFLSENHLEDNMRSMKIFQNAIDAITLVNGYTVTELRKAFDEVANPADWKDIIDAWINVEDWGVTASAIEFMTASKPWIAEDKHDKESGVIIIRVQGRGYRAGPAGP